MLQKIKRKKSLLLTAVILAATSVPSYAAEKKQEKEKIKTSAVVVTASKTEQEVKETPTTVEVITREDIEKMGAESLYQALQLTLGMDVMEKGIGNNLSIRGMRNNHTLLLVDGRRVRTEITNDTANAYELERFNIDDVERIEIVRSAASALYGSEALGGVVNIILKKPGKEKTAITTDWTSSRKDGGIRYDTGKHGKWNLSASFKNSDYRTLGDESRSNLHGKKYFFNIEGRMDLTKDKYLDIFANYLDEKLDQREYSINHVDYVNKRLSTGIKYAGRDKRGDYEAQVYYTHFDRNQEQRYVNHPKKPDGTLKDFDDITFRSLVFDGRRSLQMTKDHLLTFGGEYRKEDYEGSRIKGGKWVTREAVRKNFGENSENYAALYVQDEWLVNPNWLIIPSLRLDHSSAFGSKVTGNFGTTYKINKNLRFKTNIGTAYRVPTALERYFDWGNGVIQIDGNPDLKPETSLNFDLGFEWEKAKTFTKLTYFHNKVENLIVTKNLPSPPKYHSGYENANEATLQGIEWEVRQDLGSGFFLRGLYSYLDAHDDTYDSRIVGRPYHKASLQLSYEDEKNGWHATIWNDWLAGYYYIERVGRKNVGKNAAISVLNLVINKKISDTFSAYLGIDNIFEADHKKLPHEGRIWRGGIHMTF